MAFGRPPTNGLEPLTREHLLRMAAAEMDDARPAGAGMVTLNPLDGLKYVWIPAGDFMMGCSPEDRECEDDEKPAHRVVISEGFWLGQTEVTVGAFKRFASATGTGMPPKPTLGDDARDIAWSNEQMPIVNAGWEDADDYCRWAGGRLPTEAEWEYAARAGSKDARYGPLDAVAWDADNSGRERIDSLQIWREMPEHYHHSLQANGNRPHEVGQKRPNGFNLYDTLGNVLEWVNDRYGDKYYEGSPERDPQGPGRGGGRVLRGGSWNFTPKDARVSSRGWSEPDVRFIFYGFRCSRGVVP